jgi:hypothetical protein
VAPAAPPVLAPTLSAGAARLEARRVRAAHAARLAASEAALEARIAGSCLPAMPTVTAVALLVLGGVATVSAVDGAALAAAAALTVVGVRWTWRLPTTPSRLFAGVERRLDGQQRHLEHVRDALELAELHAVAGLDGTAALDAAVGGDAGHPLQRLRTAPVSGSSALPWGEGSLVGALARCEARLHYQHQGDVYRRRLQLVRLRAVGPFLACALPATALVVVALSS